MADDFKYRVQEVEAAIREFKRRLDRIMTHQSELHRLARWLRHVADHQNTLADKAEISARSYLEQAGAGTLSPKEAEALATEALVVKLDHLAAWQRLAREADQQDALTGELQSVVDRLWSNIRAYEAEAISMKARGRSAATEVKSGRDRVFGGPAAHEAGGGGEGSKGFPSPDDADPAVALDARIAAALGRDPESRAREALSRLKKRLGLE